MKSAVYRFILPDYWTGVTISIRTSSGLEYYIDSPNYALPPSRSCMISRVMFIQSKENHIAAAKKKIEVQSTSKTTKYKKPRRTTPKILFNQTRVWKFYTTQSRQISSYNRIFTHQTPQNRNANRKHGCIGVHTWFCVRTCIKTTRIKRWRNITRLSLRRWRWSCCRNLANPSRGKK